MLAVPYDPAHKARRADPSTSKDAARKAASFVNTHAGLIHLTLVRGKSAGIPNMSAKEIAERSELRLDQVYRRRNELEKLGLVRVLHTPDGEPIKRDGCQVWEVI